MAGEDSKADKGLLGLLGAYGSEEEEEEEEDVRAASPGKAGVLLQLPLHTTQ